MVPIHKLQDWHCPLLAAAVVAYCIVPIWYCLPKGIYTLKLFKEGSWRYLHVDDRLPCSPSRALQFCSCRDPNQARQWACHQKMKTSFLFCLPPLRQKAQWQNCCTLRARHPPTARTRADSKKYLTEGGIWVSDDTSKTTKTTTTTTTICSVRQTCYIRSKPCKRRSTTAVRLPHPSTIQVYSFISASVGMVKYQPWSNINPIVLYCCRRMPQVLFATPSSISH